MDKVNFFLASLFAATAVAAGAFGAHGLQRLTAETTVIQTYQTAVQYHFWHAIACSMCIKSNKEWDAFTY